MEVRKNACKVKICGITNLKDALLACDAGADAIGFIFYEKSPRYVNPMQVGKIIKELPPLITTVGVFVNQEEEHLRRVGQETGIDIYQLHGDESPEFCRLFGAKVIKAYRIKGKETIAELPKYQVFAYLLDTYHEGLSGGTGQVFNWEIAVEAKRYGRIVLAGGLTPENVSDAVVKVRPYAVDVSTGVELEPGKKDENKLRKFIQSAKRA